MLKRWHYGFDPEFEGIKFRHLWVLLLGLPITIWNKEYFVAIGNHIGLFLHVDEEILNGVDKRVGIMLVDIDMSWGLLE